MNTGVIDTDFNVLSILNFLNVTIILGLGLCRIMELLFLGDNCWNIKGKIFTTVQKEGGLSTETETRKTEAYRNIKNMWQNVNHGLI